MFKKALDTVKIAGLSFTSTSESRLLAFLIEKIKSGGRVFITTPNPEFLVFARHNSWFKLCLDKADIAIPDGMGLIWAGKLLNKPIKERISGTDLTEKLCQLAVKNNWRVYLIGGQPGVARKALETLKGRYSGLKGEADSSSKLKLVGGEWTLGAERGVKKTVKEINSQKPDLLFVALGMGKQEKFIADNWSRLNVKIAMGVGGAFDYLSGEVVRAPKWLRNFGLEWLYRLFRQPWRWRRQLRLMEFVWLVLQEKFTA